MPHLPSSILDELPGPVPIWKAVSGYVQDKLPLIQEEVSSSESVAVKLVEDLINGGVGLLRGDGDGAVVHLPSQLDPGLEWERAKEKVPDMSQAWKDVIAFSKETIEKAQPGMEWDKAKERLPDIGKAWEEFNPVIEWDKTKEKLPNMDEAWKDFADFSKDSIAKTETAVALTFTKGSEAVNKFHTEHPIWVAATGAIVILVCLSTFFPFVLAAIGFGVAGVVKGSIAAAIQAVYYGAFVPAGSLFALLTSCGATIASPSALLVVIAIALIVWTVFFLVRV